MDNDPEAEAVAAALAASSATQRKWASFVLLGPLIPSLIAITNIVIGGAIVKASGETLRKVGVDVQLVYSTIWLSLIHI